MAWFNVDDALHSSRKFLSIPKRTRFAAVGLWTIAGSWAAGELTDGHIPEYMISLWGPPPSAAKNLVDAGLWEKVSDGYQFCNWLEYQRSKARVEADRAASRARMRKTRATVEPESESESTSTVSQEPQEQADSGDLFAGTSDGVRLPNPSHAKPSHTGTSKEVPKRVKKEQNRPLPEDWEPTPEHRKFSAEHGIDLGHEVAKFKAHADTHQRKAVRWNSAFTSWLLKAKEFQTRSPSGGGFSRPSIDRQGDLLKAEAARIQAKYENQQPRLEIEP